MTKLFKIYLTGITKHINNIYKDEKIEEIINNDKNLGARIYVFPIQL